jgi:hypothetical protein
MAKIKSDNIHSQSITLRNMAAMGRFTSRCTMQFIRLLFLTKKHNTAQRNESVKLFLLNLSTFTAKGNTIKKGDTQIVIPQKTDRE